MGRRCVSREIFPSSPDATFHAYAHNVAVFLVAVFAAARRVLRQDAAEF